MSSIGLSRRLPYFQGVSPCFRRYIATAASAVRGLALVGITLCLAAGEGSAKDEYIGRDFSRRQIYHSPQTPGYTCWVGAWKMPDESFMICFTQATGPLEGRPAISEELRKKLSWPKADKPMYDFTGLDLRNIYLRSVDQGKAWKLVGSDPFKTPAGQMSQGGPQIALPDSTIIRAVFGYHLPLDADIPKTGYLQRSTDGGKTWGERQVLFDPETYTYRFTRLRWLRDGRMVGLGGIASVNSNKASGDRITELWRPMFVVSSDSGKTWKQLEILPEGEWTSWGGEEWDIAELANGDLLAVFRRLDPDDRQEASALAGIAEEKWGIRGRWRICIARIFLILATRNC